VHAETSTQRRAAAEVLFKEGGQLFREGKFEAACVKLARSQELDPAVGTLLNLARCYEKIGRTASAWVSFVDAASAAKAAGQTEREEVARAGANRLAGVIAKLSIQVPDAVAVEGLEITRDGEALPPAMWNVASPTDPGDHVIEVKAPNKKPWSTKVHLEPAKEETINVPPLVDAPREARTGAQASGLGTQRIAAIVTAGVGVASIGAGSLFGILAKSDASRANETCSGKTCSDQGGLDANNRALTKANLATIFIGAGAACVAGGAVLWFTAPSREQKRGSGSGASFATVVPLVDASTRGVLVEGRF
jgi:hypothetical protein